MNSLAVASDQDPASGDAVGMDGLAITVTGNASIPATAGDIIRHSQVTASAMSTPS
jgi:hypothetical protein